MSLLRFGQTPPRRPKVNPTAADWLRMARHPSSYAPTAAEVLTPLFVGPPRSVPGQHLRAVLDDPDADAPRLAFAEWVDAVDPARAAFIRAQLSGDPTADGLMAQHGPRWAEEFAPWGARDFLWRRGFVEGMSLTGRSFINLGAALLDRTPLREVRLIAVNFLMGELVRCPHLEQLKVLDLRGNRIGDAGGEMISGCAHLDGLRELDVRDNDLSEPILARIKSRWPTKNYK